MLHYAVFKSNEKALPIAMWRKLNYHCILFYIRSIWLFSRLCWLCYLCWIYIVWNIYIAFIESNIGHYQDPWSSPKIKIQQYWSSSLKQFKRKRKKLDRTSKRFLSSLPLLFISTQIQFLLSKSRRVQIEVIIGKMWPQRWFGQLTMSSFIDIR